MRVFRKLLLLTPRDRRMLTSALFTVAVVRASLWIFPFSVTQRFCASPRHRARLLQSAQGHTCIERVCSAVTIASRYIPSATCLTQALAANFLLQRRGHPTTLRIGVAKDLSGKLEAHAWLENNGRVIIGGPDAELKGFTSLGTFESGTET
jgi:hypothetical protein